MVMGVRGINAANLRRYNVRNSCTARAPPLLIGQHARRAAALRKALTGREVSPGCHGGERAHDLDQTLESGTFSASNVSGTPR